MDFLLLFRDGTNHRCLIVRASSIITDEVSCCADDDILLEEASPASNNLRGTMTESFKKISFISSLITILS
jgi:hypothetical protein